MSSFGRDRDQLLQGHPTVKPAALVADAIKDCSKRGDLILDPFGGSGTTMIAAEKTKRRAALIELDPHYGNTLVRGGKPIRTPKRWMPTPALASRNANVPSPPRDRHSRTIRMRH